MRIAVENKEKIIDGAASLFHRRLRLSPRVRTTAVFIIRSALLSRQLGGISCPEEGLNRQLCLRLSEHRLRLARRKE